MQLEPCTRCRRHVDAKAASCVFCGSPHDAANVPRAHTFARLSRASAFVAGTALAGCYTSTPAPQPPPPRHPATPDAQPAAQASIAGMIVEQHSGNLLPDIPIYVDGVVKTTTNAEGRYTLTLPAGTYTIEVRQGYQTGGRWPHREVVVEPGRTQRVDLAIYVIDPMTMPNPYGAPPARKRVV